MKFNCFLHIIYSIFGEILKPKIMKKLCVLFAIGMIAFTSCKKNQLCVVTTIKTSLQPCEGYPTQMVNVYENSYNQYHDGITLDTVKYCSDNIWVEEKVIINCN